MVIKTFGPIREQLGADYQLDIEIDNVKSLREQLHVRHPHIQWSAVAVAVNKYYATDDVLIKNGDEIALIPPVSGG
jgi:molybdopterin synthase sulfur carrier subunit